MSRKERVCLKCGGEDFVKNGTVRGVPKVKCKKCGAQSDVMARAEEDRIPHERHFKAHPDWKRSQGVALYCLGLSMSAVGKFLKVGTTTVMRWVESFARKNCVKTPPESVVVVELDEMWHFLKKNPIKSGSGRLIVAIQTSSSIGNAVVVTLPLSKSFSRV